MDYERFYVDTFVYKIRFRLVKTRLKSLIVSLPFHLTFSLSASNLNHLHSKSINNVCDGRLQQTDENIISMFLFQLCLSGANSIISVHVV